MNTNNQGSFVVGMKATHDLINRLGRQVTGKKVTPFKRPTITFDYYALGVAYVQECICQLTNLT